MSKGDLEILHTLTSTVHESFDLQHIYDTAIDLVLTLKDVDIAFIYMVTNDRKEAFLAAHSNLTEDYLKRASRIPYPNGITWKLINTGQVINVDDVQKDKTVGPAGKTLGHRRGLGIPIKLNGIVMGAIWLTSYKKGRFSEEEVKLITTVGNNIGIAIAKAKLYNEMEDQVINRTLELEDANQRLRQEIQDRKKAEEEVKAVREEQQLVDAISNLINNMNNVFPIPKPKLFQDRENTSHHQEPPHELLSKQEYKVMIMITSGMSIKDIANETYLSSSTISTYRARILEKLNLSSNAELIRYAIRNNLID